MWLWRVVAEKWYDANDCNTFLYWESVSFALWKSFRSNKFASWVCFTIVSVCVCVFVWHQKLCSSHCQSQITNDTNSPRALTISTLTRSPSLHDEHTHTHTQTQARTQSFTHSATHSLARTRTLPASQREEARRKNETKRKTKPEMRCRSKQVTCSPLWGSMCVRVCICIWDCKKNWAQLKNTSALFCCFCLALFLCCCCFT